MKKEKVNIKVTTIPNGYALDVDNQKFMYFSLKDLLEGFMYHVGLQELGEVDKETIELFLNASVVWSKNSSLVKELIRQKQKNEILQKRVSGLKRRLKEKGKEDVEDDEYGEDE